MQTLARAAQWHHPDRRKPQTQNRVLGLQNAFAPRRKHCFPIVHLADERFAQAKTSMGHLKQAAFCDVVDMESYTVTQN